MIKISKNNIGNRIFGALIQSVPIFVLLYFAMPGREYVVQVIIFVCIMTLLLIGDIYINFFDYTIWFDANNKEWVVKRFKKELRFKNVKEFTIRPYFLSKTLFFYSIELCSAKFWFRYPYLNATLKQSYFQEDFANEVHDEMLQTVQNAINNPEKQNENVYIRNLTPDLDK